MFFFFLFRSFRFGILPIWNLQVFTIYICIYVYRVRKVLLFRSFFSFSPRSFPVFHHFRSGILSIRNLEVFIIYFGIWKVPAFRIMEVYNLEVLCFGILFTWNLGVSDSLDYGSFFFEFYL